MIRRLAIFLVIGALLLGALGPTAFAEGSGAIKGKLNNKTAGGKLPEGQEVVLQILSQDSPDAKTATTKAKEDGSFEFTGLETGETSAYVVSSKYNDVDFSTDIVAFQSGETEKTVDLNVYETTESPEGIIVSQDHAIIQGFDPESKQVSVLEILVLTNPGDKAYVGKKSDSGKRSTFTMNLPPQAVDVQVGHDEIIQASSSSPNTYIYGKPLTPGDSQVMLAYLLSYTGQEIEFTRSVEFPTGRVSVLVEQSLNLKISSPQLAGQSVQDINGKSYVVASGLSVPAGGAVTLRISGLGASRSSQATIMIAVFGLVVVVLGVALGLLLYRKRAGVPTQRKRRREDAGTEDEEDDVALGELIEP